MCLVPIAVCIVIRSVCSVPSPIEEACVCFGRAPDRIAKRYDQEMPGRQTRS